MNLTNLIYMLVGALSGVATTLLGRRFINDASILSILVTLVIATAMGLSRVYLIPYYRATTYEFFSIREDPALKIISQRYPQQFNDFLMNAKKGLLAHESKDIEQLYKIELLNAVTARIISKASNASIYDYYKTEVDLYKNLYEIDPKLVLFLEFSGQFTEKPDPSLIIILGGGDDMIQKIISAKEAIMLSAIKAPQPPLNAVENKEIARQLSDIFTEISDSYGPDAFASLTTKPESTDIDPKNAALMIMAFYSDILAKGENQGGMIFKYLNTPQSVKQAPH